MTTQLRTPLQGERGGNNRAVVSRYHLNDTVQALGRAMLQLEDLDRRVDLTSDGDETDRRARAAIIRAHVLTEAAFGLVKSLRDEILLADRLDPVTSVRQNGELRGTRRDGRF